MNAFLAQFLFLLRDKVRREKLKKLLHYMFWFAAIVTMYSVIFHVLMAQEGREFSLMTGFYWTLTVMSTLGFGDITFASDLGRFFSMIVLGSGTVSMLILLPLTFINFFYEPWMEARGAARAPRACPETTIDHVILTEYDAITRALINKLKQYDYPYVLLVPSLKEGLELYDKEVNVVVGELDDPDTYRNVRVDHASLVFAAGNDVANTNVAFTVRQLSKKVPIYARARNWATVEILKSLDTNHVLRPSRLMADALARNFIGGSASAQVIGNFELLMIGEAAVAGTPLVGKSLMEAKSLNTSGLSTIGIWERGEYEIARWERVLTEHSVLLLAGYANQFEEYNRTYKAYHASVAPVVIVGGGRVGRATGYALAKRGIDYRIVEKNPALVHDTGKYIEGNAAELDVLERAGFMKAPAVFITSSQDEVNIYLTIYYRRLRPDIEIISRATMERHVHSLNRAGADFVLSYASMGATAIFNTLKRSDILMVSEGLEAFRIPMPEALVGQTIQESQIRALTGCSVVAIVTSDGPQINPDPLKPLPPDSKLILIGNTESETKFLKLFCNHKLLPQKPA